MTCKNAYSFQESFKNIRPQLIKEDQSCKAANGSKMNSLGVFEIPMAIRGCHFLHPVAVMEDIKDNIVGIDFINANEP